jgi:lipid A ethanolaminephosphotransferase
VKSFPNRTIADRTLIVLLSVWFVLLYNGAFFRHVAQVYPLSWGNCVMLGSIPIILTAVLIVFFTLLSSRYTTKPIIIAFLLVSSLTAYFMDTYEVIVDTNMIRNVLETNLNEATDLLTLRLAGYFLLLGVLPSVIVCRLKVDYLPLKARLMRNLKTVAVALAVISILIFAFSRFYTSFFREHKPLRLYTNPSFYVYSVYKYLHLALEHEEKGLLMIGKDAAIPPTDIDRDLIILVVGEAARADRFSLNGYGRETNPLLKKEDIINFPDFTSCGTDTAVSVPCMFSSFGRAQYDGEKARHTENLLDVLGRAGVNILWRENNSDSKGVALRAQYENFKSPKMNPLCEGECRDEGMLAGLQEYIDSRRKGDVLIVLHQMGNHGPAYYKRYPDNFEKFTPACKSNQLENCTREEISNAYDNAILYTDYFLSKVIGLLKKNSGHFETAMFYVSDHGQSLGENGIYLHGLPYYLAPATQKHVPAIMWFGNSFNVDKKRLAGRSAQPFSHDNLFHTMMGFMEVRSTVYRPDMDILKGLR